MQFRTKHCAGQTCNTLHPATTVPDSQ